MSIKVALEHRTTYTFAEPVVVSPHVVRLRPAPTSRTPIEAYSLDVRPANHFVNWQQDPFGNWLARLVFPDKVKELDISVGLVADLVTVNPFDFFVEQSAERYPFAYDDRLASDLAPYLREVSDSASVTPFREGLATVPDDGLATVNFLVSLNKAVYDAVSYEVRLETGVQTPDRTLERGIGSCRDSAWLLVALLRQYGLAARFVSGYLVQLATDPYLAEAMPGAPGPTEDFTDLHAWAEAYVPGAGWVGMDATSGLFAGEGHIPLCATPEPAGAAPIEGATARTEVTLTFHNEVSRVQEEPRVTAPFTEQAWARIDALGEQVDERLRSGDVRLTMGGEPTFVAAAPDPKDAAQWNVAADGAQKRELAGRLAERLREVYAVGGAVHRGQGKWYPGEALPRWQIMLQWRPDGVPLWHDATLFDDPWASGKHGPGAAEALAGEVTRILGLPAEQARPAYEDPLTSLAAEIRRPEGAPPGPEPTADEVAGLDAALTTPTGWVLPLVLGEEWSSPDWSLRRGRLVLGPGTSAVGLRLPLDSVSWTSPDAPDQPSYLEAGPAVVPGIPSVGVVSPDEQPTTALAVEERGGHVFVFLPPTQRFEDYVDVLHVVETAAAALGQPVVLEGYTAPPDPRLTTLSVTPDPGVVEVNLQPTASWAEQREVTHTLYAAARQVGLTTEKFDNDGAHTGTGGGNHITLGGSAPIDSPMLRRPDLLASMVAYWQRHPALSYLFSGRFIGPTSQAPRFDEGRPEATYEMEIAFAEIARLTAAAPDGEPRPWLVDRALRHLLTDLTGNTHRAEFCIDKMYSPDSSRGRLGLLELRGFEMPPHPQMGLLQALLVRSLVAIFWERPYVAPLRRWGTALHEDFLLPEGAIRDIREVVAEVRSHGIDFEESWLDAFAEFRFPRIGVATISPGAGTGTAVELELRTAIEPWHVLGEEATGSGTARYVDSSVERLQVRVRGIDPDRHLVTCQGVPVPLTPTGVAGEFYAGVRFRAWSPWSALHPSIAPHAPLHLDLVDVDAQVSLGGATYHVVHPGGRSFESPPVNAAAAEARRAARFEPRGHTAGALDVDAIRERGRRAASPDYPHTLDLRRSVP